jgi:hypothetical protein
MGRGREACRRRETRQARSGGDRDRVSNRWVHLLGRTKKGAKTVLALILGRDYMFVFACFLFSDRVACFGKSVEALLPGDRKSHCGIMLLGSDFHVCIQLIVFLGMNIDNKKQLPRI